MAHDLRNYKTTIAEAVARERKADPNWSWSIKAINKSEARIGWTYLDYIGCTEFFTVKIWVDDDAREEEDTMVIGNAPNGCKVYCWIGPYHWNDTDSVDSGIRMVIHALASNAHNTY